MTEIQSLVSNIERKVAEITNQNHRLREQIRALQETNEALLSEVEIHKEELNKLQELNIALKAGHLSFAGKDTTEVKLKINELVREINNCIGLLTRQD